MNEVLTAGEIVLRIQQQVGVPWSPETVDTFKTGSPATTVTGVAVTMFPTLETLRSAAAAGLNFIVAHEPAFYSHLDDITALQASDDRVLAAKWDFARRHNIAIWRFHDHWHRRQPDGILEGMVPALGWDEYRSAFHPLLFEIPPETLRDLASEIKSRLGIKALRVVGDPDLMVSRPALAPGAPGFGHHLALLQRPDVDALLIGEVPEWETISYVNDAAAAGLPKALIVLGHIPSEQAGMELCARWLSGFVPEVPVKFLPNEELFWPVF